MGTVTKGCPRGKCDYEYVKTCEGWEYVCRKCGHVTDALPCPACNGTGGYPKPWSCPSCGGTGKQE